MTDQDSDRDPVELLADDFLARFRRGERPSVEDYAARHPEIAHQIRELLPALVFLEEGKSATAPATVGFELPTPPTQLGDFLILREIGRGGMGVVYESVQRSLGRHVALKVLPRRAPAGSSRLERFQMEARAAARLHHTNIVPVFGVGECDGVHYFAMQFIRGQALDLVVDALRSPRGDSAVTEEDGRPATAVLARSLRAGRYVSAPDDDSGVRPVESSSGGSGAAYYRNVARIGVQVAEALAHAHGHGVLHRDIKPSNLLLDAGGTVWVTDFGLAKSEEGRSLTETGDLVGTLRYMAPERFDGWSDTRSDVYSLGATLYELIALRAAFPESDRLKLIRRVVHGEPTPLHRLDRRVPRDLETIVLKAMAREPGRRYASAEAMAEDLRRFASNRPILARRSNAAERVWSWCRRQPVLAGAVVSTTAALVVVAVLALRYAEQQRRFASEKEEAARRISLLAVELRSEQENLRTTLTESNRMLAVRNFDRGQAALEQDQVGQGMLWMIESWRAAAAAGDPARSHAARANLAAWRPHLPRLRAVLSHPNPVEAAAFSPDGKTVVTGGDDRTARLWDVATALPVGVPMPHEAEVTCVAFSPDGRIILTGGNDRTARLWDAATGRSLGPPLPHERPVTAVAFGPDGRTFFTGGAHAVVRSWDTASARPVAALGPMGPDFCALIPNPDGKTLLTAGNAVGVIVWDVATSRPVRAPFGGEGFVRSAAVGGDGRSVVLGYQFGVVQLWDATTGRPVSNAGRIHADRVRALALSPDGRTILTGSNDKTARLLDAATLRPIGRPIPHDGPVVAAAFSPDGESFLTVSSDHTVRIWDASPDQPLGMPLDDAAVAAYAPDGRSIFCLLGDGSVRIVDADTGRPLGRPLPHRIDGHVLAVRPDGRLLVTTIDVHHSRRWDAVTGRPVGEPLFHQGMNVENAHALALSPDGETILMGGQDRTIRLWRAATGEPLCPPILQPGTVDATAFHPDGGTFATAYDSGAVRLWDLATTTPVGEPFPHGGCVSSVAFGPDGETLVTGCEDSSARVWDVATRTQRVPPLRHPGWVWSVAVSPDGRTVLTGCEDGKARLWDLATGVPLGPAITHTRPVKLGRFSPDGSTFLTDDRAGRRVFRTPVELPDDPERMAAWVEVLTGLTLDPKHGSIEVLDNAAWHAAKERLARLGGPPETGDEASRGRPCESSIPENPGGLGGGGGGPPAKAPSVASDGAPATTWIDLFVELFEFLRGNRSIAAETTRPFGGGAVVGGPPPAEPARKVIGR